MLTVSNLSIRLQQQSLYIAKGVNLTIPKGKTVGLIGESGCGKTISTLALLRLLPNNVMFQESGTVTLDGEVISDLPLSAFRKVRGKAISMIFQDAMTSLNPVLTIGKQMMEILILHLQMNKREARQEAIQWLNKVGMPSAEEIMNKYPHQLSGGMKQRIMIAMAVCCYPKVVIADEPTTALDVTVQKQILDLLKQMQEEQATSLLLVTHDLGVVAYTCDSVAVMYAGFIVEVAETKNLFENAKHPYTKGLLESVQSLVQNTERLQFIEGQVPPLNQRSKGCPFVDRCLYAKTICHEQMPLMQSINKTSEHQVACYHVAEEMGS